MTTTRHRWPSAEDARQLRLTRECEKLDTRRLLQIADAYELLRQRYTDDVITDLVVVPIQGNVTALDRLHEANRVYHYWPDHLLVLAQWLNVTWNTLAEPPRWTDVDPADVFAFVDDHYDRTGKWPIIDALRPAFGRRRTNVVKGDRPGQQGLGLEDV